MKKQVLLIAAFAAAVFTTNEVNAQDFKPAGGEKNIEVNFAPLGSNPISINTLRFRYFKSSTMAIRVGFSLSMSSESTPDIKQVGADNEAELTDTKSSFGFALNPGVEWHWAGTDRLSPYWGLELNFSTTSSSEIDEELDGTTADLKDSYESETTNSSATIGLNAVLGADWYFSKSIYMGTEVGFGFASTGVADQEVTNPTGPKTKTAKTPQTSTFNLGPNFNSSIRLGFLF